MLFIRKSWSTASLVVLGGLLVLALSSISLRAGDRKSEDKKVDQVGKQAETGPLLSKSAELKADDEKDIKLTDSPRKIFPIKLTAGKTYQIDLKSKEFDAFLRLEDSTGKEVAFNDDADASTLDSRIVYKSAKTGDYKIIVTSFDRKSGKFNLTAIELDGKAAPATLSKFPGKAIELKLEKGKAEYPSEFGENDPKALERFHYKVFTVQLEKGKIYRIDHRGSGGDAKFDPYLILEDEAGKQIDFDDDSGGGLDSRIVRKIAKTGTYRLIATTFVADQTGKFTLEIRPPDAKEARTAELMYRATGFASLKKEQRTVLADEFRKHLQELDGDLTFHDFRVAFELAIEAELEGSIPLARDVLKESVKQFAAANSPQITGLTAPLEGALKNLDRLGKVIEINGKTVAGKEFDLKNLKGKVVLVDFWGTWCGPCIEEVPNIIAAYEKYHGKGFDVIGVSSDKKDDVVVKFLKEKQIPWACINVEDSRTQIDNHGVTGYPTTMLIDQSGRLVSMRARGPYLERLLDRLLEQQK